MFYLWLLVTTLLLLDSYNTETLSNCESKETCSECIQELNCVWCISPPQNLTLNHCSHKDSATDGWCNAQFIINPESSFKILEDKPLISSDEQAVQITPQRVQLTLRKGEEFNLQFQYAQAKNYPVDLYYIMDLSASMEDYRETLAKLGEKLAKTMMNITSNFRLGYGSFVDKVDLPFTSTVPSKLESPCSLNKKGRAIRCVSPYSFKNHLSLSSDYTKFTAEVSKAKVSGNLDATEGGFDALMQAMVCKEQIGWRAQARHLVVFSTDARYHIAGDGKLAGVVEPNDAKCHMVDNQYVDYLKYDYPSISHINYVAKESNINIIFAIVKKKYIVDSYKQLSDRIENSNLGTLDGDNVVNLVLDNYRKIVDSVTIGTNVLTDVEIKISSNCPQPKGNGCTGIHVGEVVNFTATIKPLECTTAGSNRKTIFIKPEGLNEEIVVELEVLCDCNCEFNSSQHFVSKAPQCSKLGDLKCGVCDCDPGRFGSKCECDKSTSDTEDVKNCKIKESDTEICSNLGTCKCGKCECNKRDNPQEKIYGKFCQCDNYSCNRENGALCSNRGVCDCGRCKCYAGWTGDACECPDSNSTCIRPGSGSSICSGQGTCKCGQCDCNTGSNRITGKYCEECLTCPGQRCDELRDCVECQAYKGGLYNEEDCRIKCTTFVTEIVDKIDEETVEDEVKICRMGDKRGCTFIFQYEYLDTKELVVKAAKEKVCIGALNLLVWIMGVIGTIVLAGIVALIIWKLCTTIHDQREFAKFENERNNLRWNRNDNPLYKQATTTFANPAYNRSSRLFSFKK